MIHAPLPLPVLIFGIISFGLYLSSHKRKSRPHLRPFPVVPKNDYTCVEEIYEANKECASEKIDVSVLDIGKSKMTMGHPLGYPVSLAYEDGHIYLVVDNVNICVLSFPSESKIRHIVSNNLHYSAFITDRETEASGFMDFFTITIFYNPD